jgi:arylsulfatase A-like enzyme
LNVLGLSAGSSAAKAILIECQREVAQLSATGCSLEDRLSQALLIAVAAWLCGGAVAADSGRARPNIIFLLADDLRWDALGCTGNQLAQTPHIDSLAGGGTVFRNHFVTTSICCVSRASLLSGQYARRHGINSFSTPFSARALAQTYPLLLRAAGYRTGFIGKFGVSERTPDSAFDYWRGFPGQGDYFAKGDPVHLTRKMGDQALEFLATTDARPFCLSVSYKAPHAQDNARREFPPDPRDEALFANVRFPVPPTAQEKYYFALPEFVQKSEGRVRWQRRFANADMYQQTVRDYHRLVAGIDREVGRLLADLRERGLADKTVVVFSSDNGFFLGERGLAGKWLMYEPSIRVPLIVFDPGAPAAKPGRTVDAMTLNIDVAPTLLDYAGLPLPPAMQGRSLRPLVRGQNARWRKDWLYEHHTLPAIIPPSEGVRTERWKYLRWVGVTPAVEEVYDLKADPLETTNLAAAPECRETLHDLRRRWSELRKELE